MKRAIILVMDSFGIGFSEDAARFGDEGANTLGHIAETCARGEADEERSGPLRLPVLNSLGLGPAAQEAGGRYPEGLDRPSEVIGRYGHAAEISSGKDTPSGHWEMAGVPVLFEWGYFSERKNSFPLPLLEELVRRADLPGVLGNCHASGTEILLDLGAEHVRSAKPIVYTSADSVFQIACHEESFGLERLYEVCAIARELVDEYNIGRVIARPFVGSESTGFVRTGHRKDLAVKPPAPTLLDRLSESGGEVIAVGKIGDIFSQSGVTRSVKAHGLDGLFDVTLEAVASAGDRSLVFTNFVDFDSAYGHRRDVPGYAQGLEHFDRRMPELLDLLGNGDVMVITADHGCDPTWHGTDHTREYVPVLVYSPGISPGSLGRRDTFADTAQTLAEHLNLKPFEYGESFLPQLGLSTRP